MGTRGLHDYNTLPLLSRTTSEPAGIVWVFIYGMFMRGNVKIQGSLSNNNSPLRRMRQYWIVMSVFLLPFRQFVFSAFTEEFISPPFTEQVFHFFVPALADPRLAFPFQDFLWSLQATIASSAVAQAQAPWLFYFVLSVGETGLGTFCSSLTPLFVWL